MFFWFSYGRSSVVVLRLQCDQVTYMPQCDYSFQTIIALHGCYNSAVDEPKKMKIVGRRTPPSGGLEASNNLFKLGIALLGDKPFFPKGVYRFKSYEEKEAWEWEMRTRSSRVPQH